jgi:plastocyanin
MRLFTALALTSGALASVALGGCGSNFSEKPGPAPVIVAGRVNNEGTRDVTRTTRLELELRNFAFKPTFLRAQPGQTLSLDLHNTTDAQHSFTLVDVPNGLDVVVRPHRSVHVDVTAPLSGMLVFTCRFHEARGMQGAIFILPGQPVLGAPGGATSTTRTPFPSGWGS